MTFSPPEVFDFEPSSWHTWIRKFERFRRVSGLASKEGLSGKVLDLHNVIYEWAKFNKRSQEVGESAEHFITDVHKMAEHCNYGDLREEMIRDKIVVGIRDAGLSETLQLNAKLDLATAIAQVRQHEDVKTQQTVL